MPRLRKAYLFIYLLIYSFNFCSVFEEFDGRMDNVKTRIRIKHDGHCFWAAPFVFKTSCHFKVHDFPFDKQQCKLKFGSWLFTSKDLDLFRKNEKAQVAENMLDNGEWDVTSIDIKKNVVTYSCCPDDKYPDITFVINLKRRSLFYTYNLITPNFLIALLAFFSFYIPVECGERISFVITVLLSMTVFLLLVAESIPPTSEAVPVIGMYYTSSIIEVALALVATGISLKVYYTYLYGSGLSPGLRKFLFYRLAPLLCFNTEIAGKKEHRKKKSCLGNPFKFLNKLRPSSQRNSDLSMYNVSVNCDAVTPHVQKNGGVNLDSVEMRKSNTKGVVDSQDELSDQELRQRFKQDAMSAELKSICSVVKDHKDSERHAAECRIAAAIVDRAFMVLFVLVFCLSTLIILCLPFINNS